MKYTQQSIKADVEAVSRISIIPSLLDVICRTTGMGFAAVARVTEDKWVVCAVKDDISFGLQPGGELEIKTTICDEIRQSGEAVVIDHVTEDRNFCGHPTPAMYGFQSYISMPIIRKDGNFFGTLCAIDPKPARLNKPETIGMFRLFADLIAFHLQTVDDLARTETSLQEERRTAELREQFIAILGHDLRNPVGAISGSAQLLQHISQDENVVRLANVINNSSYRVLGLINNLLDFARGRMGEGIILNRETTNDLEGVLNQVMAELTTIWPDRVIERSFNFTIPVTCDSSRIAQLFSNLLSNALMYGDATEPVKVEAYSSDATFTLSVSNAGKEITPSAMERLFTAFSRAEVKPGQQGLGLGLYIAAEIARVHGGKISVISSPEQTRFTLRMPAA